MMTMMVPHPRYERASGACSHSGARGRLLQVLALSALLVAGGCAIVPPDPVVIGPVTAPPSPPAPPLAVPNGSIYQPALYGSYPLFEDRRPRNVGDTVTIALNERLNATKNVSTTSTRNGSAGITSDGGTGIFSPRDFSLGGNNSASGQGSSSSNNVFTGSITTTVIGVLPNGNLQVAGEKQIAINRGSQYVKFSGVVDPRAILGDNTVSSTQVADARIEYRSKGVMDEVQTMGWLQRFFLIASPF